MRCQTPDAKPAVETLLEALKSLDTKSDGSQLVFNAAEYLLTRDMNNQTSSVTFGRRGTGALTVLNGQRPGDGNLASNDISSIETTTVHASQVALPNTDWYTRPLHGNRTPRESESKTSVPSARPASARPASLASTDQSAVCNTTLQCNTHDNLDLDSVKLDNDRLERKSTADAELALKYFPVTLSCTRELPKMTVGKINLNSNDVCLADTSKWRPGKSSGKSGCRPGSSRSSTSSRSHSRRSRPDSAHSSSSSTSRTSLDRVAMMAVDPLTSGQPPPSPVWHASPTYFASTYCNPHHAHVLCAIVLSTWKFRNLKVSLNLTSLRRYKHRSWSAFDM